MLASYAIGVRGRIAAATALALALAACIGPPQGRPGGIGRPHPAVSDTPVRLGRPYTIRGITYTPKHDPRYDRLGYASWYGSESGSTTANGERFYPHGISAAHTTLPLPTYAEVTALNSGRTILVRINDRGPFIRGSNRIIDLSRAAAKLLGIRRQGIAAVRVRVIQPPEADKRRLREGRAATDRPRVPERELRRLRARLGSTGRR